MKQNDLTAIAKYLPNNWTCYNCITEILPINTNNLDEPQTHFKATSTTNTDIIINEYPPIFFGSNELTRTTNIKFLGVVLTDTLDWTTHMTYITSKINKNIGYFYRARHILEKKRTYQSI